MRDRISLIEASHAAQLAEFSENVIEVPEARRWDYAIPDNYTNFRDGFLWPDSEPYRGMPMVVYKGEILYLKRACNYYELEPDEGERLFLFDRHNHKYVFIVKKSPVELESNPSYWDFIKRVKQFDPVIKKTVAPGMCWR